MSQMRTYSASFEGIGPTTAVDLFELQAATNVCVEILAVYLSQRTKTDAIEFLQIKFHRGTATGNGTAASEIALDTGFPAADSLVEYNATTQSVETNVLYSTNWNDLQEFQWRASEHDAIIVPGGGFFIVELAAAPAAARTMNGTLVWGERG